MEYLKEETEQLRERLFMDGVPLDFAFFKENHYNGFSSHQEAAVQLIRTLNEKRGFDFLPNVEDINDSRLSQDPNYKRIKFVKHVYHPTTYVVNSRLMSGIQITPPKDFFTPVEVIREDDPYLPLHCVDEAGRLPIRKRARYNSMFRDYSLSLGEVPEEAFAIVNDYLFPDKDRLIIYTWNNNWSNYFYEGLLLYDAYLWTIYDPPLNHFTVIGSSFSD